VLKFLNLVFGLQDSTEIKEGWQSYSEDIDSCQARPAIFCVGKEFESLSELYVAFGGSVCKVQSMYQGICLSLIVQAIFKATNFNNSTLYIWALLAAAIFKLDILKKSTVVTKILDELDLDK
jgi:hypothetical protein